LTSPLFDASYRREPVAMLRDSEMRLKAAFAVD